MNKKKINVVNDLGQPIVSGTTHSPYTFRVPERAIVNLGTLSLQSGGDSESSRVYQKRPELTTTLSRRAERGRVMEDDRTEKKFSRNIEVEGRNRAGRVSKTPTKERSSKGERSFSTHSVSSSLC